MGDDPQLKRKRERAIVSVEKAAVRSRRWRWLICLFLFCFFFLVNDPNRNDEIRWIKFRPVPSQFVSRQCREFIIFSKDARPSRRRINLISLHQHSSLFFLKKKYWNIIIALKYNLNTHTHMRACYLAENSRYILIKLAEEERNWN